MNTMRKLRTGALVTLAGLSILASPQVLAESVEGGASTLSEGQSLPDLATTPEVDPVQEAERAVAQATEVAEQAKEEATEAKEALETAESVVTEVEEKIAPVAEEVASLESAIQGTDGTALETAKAQTETLQTGVSDAEKAVDTAVEKQEIAQVNYDTAKQANDKLVEAETRLATTLSEVKATVESETAKVESLENRVADLSVPGKPVTTVVKENSDAKDYLDLYNTEGNFFGGAGESHAQPLYSGTETVVLPYEENFVPDRKEVEKYIKQYINEVRALNGLPQIVEFTDAGNEYAEFRLSELREKFSEGSAFNIHGTSNMYLSNGDRRSGEVISGVTSSSIGNSNQEFAYNLINGWMTDLFNTRHGMGHAHSLLADNLPKFGFAFDTDSRHAESSFKMGSAIVIQHAVTDLDNGILETEGQNNWDILEDTKDADGKSILLVNGKQVKLFPLRNFQYVRESAPAGEAERLTALTLAKRELEVAKSNLNKAQEAVAELSTLGGIEVKTAFTTAEANLNTAKLETLKAQGSLSLARKALNDNLNTIKSLEDVKANIESSKLKLVTLKGKLTALQAELQEAKAKVPALQEANRKAQQAYSKAMSDLSDAVANLNALKVQTGGNVVEVPVTFDKAFINNDGTSKEEAPKGDDTTKVEEAPKGGYTTNEEPIKVRDYGRPVPHASKSAEAKMTSSVQQISPQAQEGQSAVALTRQAPIAATTPSRSERQQSLPSTGLREHVLLALAGMSMLGLALVGLARKRG